MTFKEKYPELYRAFEGDTRSASRQFRAMTNALRALQDENADHPQNAELLQEKIQRLLDTAAVYRKSHRRHRFTDKGRQRFELATRLVESFYYDNEQLTENLRQVNEKERKRLEKESDKNSAAYLEKLSKLQRNIGSTNFVPRVFEFEPEPSAWQRFMANVGHGLYTALHGIATVGLSGLLWLSSVPFTRTSKKREAIQHETDYTKIPGTQDKHFEELVVSDKDDQPIFSDLRRLPINYEQPIPEDPNQPPTMSLMFDQAREGSSNAYLFKKDEDGKNKAEMGHVFVNLQYTKNDPETGKPRRYKCVFGFYPHPDLLTNPLSAAMGSDGTYIPGKLKNDLRHSYSTSQKFTVTNRQINEVFKAAEQYSKGGYNVVKRNCASFVQAMAVAAGLPADRIFFETELESGIADTMKLGALLGGDMISRIGKKTLVEKGTETSYQYHNFGQKIVDKNDIKRLDKRELNIRLKGYVPAHGAETVRSGDDFHLGSRKYITGLNEPDTGTPIGEAETNRRRVLNEKLRLLHTVYASSRKNGLHADAITEELLAYMDTASRRISMQMDKAFPDMGKDAKPEDIPTYAEQEKSVFEGTKAINDYIEGLDHIFRTTFKTDSRLNIPFQHLVSGLGRLKLSFEDRYNSLDADFREAHFRHGSSVAEDPQIGDILDPEDPQFEAKALLRFGETRVSSPDVPKAAFDRTDPTLLAGSILAFGSLRDELQMQKTVRAADNRGGKLSEDEEKLAREFEERCDSAKNFAAALRGFSAKENYSDDDIRFAFHTLVKGEYRADFSNDSSRPSNVYQQLILSKMLAPTAKELAQKISLWQTEYEREQLAFNIKKDELGEPAFSEQNAELYFRNQEKLSAILFGTLAEKMQGSPQLRLMFACLRDAGRENEQAGAADAKKQADLDASDRESLESFLTSVLKTAMRPLIAKELNRNNAQSGVSPEAVQKREKTLNVVQETNYILKSNAAAPFRQFIRTMLGQDALLSEDLIADNAREYREALLESGRKDGLANKANKDLQKLAELRTDCFTELGRLVAQNRLTLQDPQVENCLLRLVAIRTLRSSIVKRMQGVDKEISQQSIDRAANELKEEGFASEFLNKPEFAGLPKKLAGEFSANPKSDALRTEIDVISKLTSHITGAKAGVKNPAVSARDTQKQNGAAKEQHKQNVLQPEALQNKH